MNTILTDDCLPILKGMPDNSADLVFTSPPYENARSYGIDFNLKGQEWVDWAAERFVECCRVSRGLVAWVIEGQTRQFRWSATPALLMADLHRQGIKLRKPPAYQRVGIPGSGGPDWLRNDYEFIVCASQGLLPWSDNTARGHEPKYKSGGACTNRRQQGGRVKSPAQQKYALPKKANPGNVIKLHGGGGHLGSPLAHENEAPFPEKLADFFICSFCPPGGMVLDPFCGSGTTLAVAKQTGRHSFGIDIRESQTALARRRLAEVAS